MRFLETSRVTMRPGTEEVLYTKLVAINPAHIVIAEPNSSDPERSYVVLSGDDAAMLIDMPFTKLCDWLALYTH